MKVHRFIGQLLQLFIAVVACLAPLLASAQPLSFGIKIELTHEKLKPGQAVEGRVSGIFVTGSSHLDNLGVNFIVLTGSESQPSLTEEVSRLSRSEAQDRLASAAKSAGRSGNMLLQRLTGRMPVQAAMPFSLPLDHQGPIYPRSGERGLPLLEKGSCRLVVLGVLSGIDEKGKEVLFYAFDEKKVEVEPIKLRAFFVPESIRPASKIPNPGKSAFIRSRFVVEGLPLTGTGEVEITKTLVGRTGNDGQKTETVTQVTTQSVNGNSDGSPVVRIHPFSADFEQGEDLEVSISASVKGVLTSTKETLLVKMKGQGSRDSGSADVVNIETGEFSASLKGSVIEVSPEDGTAASLPIVVRGVDLLGANLKVRFDVLDEAGILRMNRFLSVVGAGEHSPQDVPLDSDGSLLWPLKIQAKPGILPGLYTLPITVFQHEGIESRLLLTLVVKPGGPLPLGILSQDWLAMPSGGTGDGAGLGGGTVRPVNRSGLPDPTAAFQALIDPGELILKPGGAAGRARILMQGLDPASQRPLEIIFIGADQGQLAGGVSVTPGSISRLVNQLGTAEFEGKVWHAVSLDFIASVNAQVGVHVYEVVVRQTGRGAGTLLISVSVDEEGRLVSASLAVKSKNTKTSRQLIGVHMTLCLF